MPKAIDLSGKVFGRWSVLNRVKSVGGNRYWLCRCDCGVERFVMVQSLRNGCSQSCGCLHAERHAKMCADRSKNALRKIPEYVVFMGIKRRCNNKNERCYKNYGGRGIECRYDSFDEFLDDVGKRPTKQHSIERNDTNGHYEPGNCKWATINEQARNRRGALKFEIDGVEKPLADWCEEYDQLYKRVWQRLRAGWELIPALTTPPLFTANSGSLLSRRVG